MNNQNQNNIPNQNVNNMQNQNNNQPNSNRQPEEKVLTQTKEGLKADTLKSKKVKYKYRVENQKGKKFYGYLDAYQTMGNICRNVKLPIELTHDIYTAYYKKG